MFVFAMDESLLKPDKDGNKLDHPTLCLKLKEEFEQSTVQEKLDLAELYNIYAYETLGTL